MYSYIVDIISCARGGRSYGARQARQRDVHGKQMRSIIIAPTSYSQPLKNRGRPARTVQNSTTSCIVIESKTGRDWVGEYRTWTRKRVVRTISVGQSPS